MPNKRVIQFLTNLLSDVPTPVAKDNPLPVTDEGKRDIPADYYLYNLSCACVLTSAVEIGDTVINVEDATDVVLGHAITFYDSVNMYQSIVKAKTASTITVSSPIDFAFQTTALIEVGAWNMAVNGATTTQVYYIKAPSGADIDVHTINVSMLSSDPQVMDDGNFGGIAQLTNGLIFRFVNGIIKNLALVVNNLGFWEIGFVIDYSDKAPAGQYGFRARRDIKNANGVTLYLERGGEVQFQAHIQDDLTDNDLLAMTINGRIVQD